MSLGSDGPCYTLEPWQASLSSIKALVGFTHATRTWAWELMMSRTSAQPSSQGLRGGERASSGVPSLALPIARLVEHDSIRSQFRKRRRSRPCVC